MSRIPANACISEKKLFYYYFSNFVLNQMKSSQVFKTGIEKAILDHLERNNLIAEPTVADYKTIQQAYNNLFDEFEMQLGKEYDSEHIFEAEKRVWNADMEIKVMKHLASKVSFSDGFDRRYQDVYSELSEKGMELLTGKKRDYGAKVLRSATYSVPTCPGSSGAKVHAYDIDLISKECTFYSMTHSMGGGKRGNRSGFGESRKLDPAMFT